MEVIYLCIVTEVVSSAPHHRWMCSSDDKSGGYIKSTSSDVKVTWDGDK
jgi:hypothetical protein